MNIKMPKDKYIAVVTIGDKGQIVIPKQAREMFGLKPNDNVLLLADKERGIAIVRNDEYLNFANYIFDAQKDTK